MTRKPKAIDERIRQWMLKTGYDIVIEVDSGFGKAYEAGYRAGLRASNKRRKRK